MHAEYAYIQGQAGFHVEPDSAEAYAADKACQVLLFHLERNRGGEQVYLHRRDMGGIRSRKENRGIYEKNGALKASRIILNNDNDDKRMLFENCRLKGNRVVNPIVDWLDVEYTVSLRTRKRQ